MALPILTPSSFTGWNKLSQKVYDADQLQAYIDEFYEKYARQILGAYDYNAIVNTDPLPQKYTDLFNGVYYFNTSCDRFEATEGLTKAIIRLIYFEWIRDNFINTGNGIGNVINKNENSTNLTGFENSAVAKSRYNDASRIVEQLCLFVDNYNEFKTQITSSIDNTGTYKINTASTLYLENGDTVTINDTDYTVSNIVLNTSFDITEATAGIDFSVYQWIHSPFENTVLTKLEYIP